MYDLKIGQILEHLSEDLDITVNLIEEDYDIAYSNGYLGCLTAARGSEKKCYKRFFGFASPCPGCPIRGQKNNFQGKVNITVTTNDNKVSYLIGIIPITKRDGEVFYLETIRECTDFGPAATAAENRKLRSIVEFARTVGHEFNQPLTGISGFCALIKEEIDEENIIYQDIAEIEKQANRLQELIYEFQKAAHIDYKEATEHEE